MEQEGTERERVREGGREGVSARHCMCACVCP